MSDWFRDTPLYIYSEWQDGSLQFLGYTPPAAYLLNHTARQRQEGREHVERGEAIAIAWDGNYTVFSPHDLAEKGAPVRESQLPPDKSWGLVTGEQHENEEKEPAPF